MSALTQSDRMVSSHLSRRAPRVPFLTAWVARSVRVALLWYRQASGAVLLPFGAEELVLGPAEFNWRGGAGPRGARTT